MHRARRPDARRSDRDRGAPAAAARDQRAAAAPRRARSGERMGDAESRRAARLLGRADRHARTRDPPEEHLTLYRLAHLPAALLGVGPRGELDLLARAVEHDEERV